MLCVSSDRKADIKVPLFPALPQWLPLDHLGRASSEEGEEGEQAGGEEGRRVAAALAAPLITSRLVPGPAASRPAKSPALLI